MILFNLAYSVDVSFHCATLKVRSLAEHCSKYEILFWTELV